MNAESGCRVIIPPPPNWEKWEKVGDEQLLAAQHGLKLIAQKFRDPAGREDVYTVCRKSPGVTICTVTQGGCLVVVGQFKQGINKIVHEFPAGMAKPGEANFAELALDELTQETGYRAESIQLLCGSPSSPAIRKFDTKEHLYVALGARRVSNQKLDSGEHAIEVLELTPPTFVQWREEGKIISTFTREAFGLALEKGFITL